MRRWFLILLAWLLVGSATTVGVALGAANSGVLSTSLPKEVLYGSEAFWMIFKMLALSYLALSMLCAVVAFILHEALK